MHKPLARNNHSWAMPDQSVTSGTRRTLMPECRCRTEADDFRKKCRCRTNFFSAFRHLLITADVSWFSSSLDSKKPRIEQNPSLVDSKPVHYIQSHSAPLRQLHLNELLCSLLSYLVTLPMPSYGNNCIPCSPHSTRNRSPR